MPANPGVDAGIGDISGGTVRAHHVEDLIRLGGLSARVAAGQDLRAVLDEALAAVIKAAGARGGIIEVREPPLVRTMGDCALPARPFEMVGLDGAAVGTVTLYFDDPGAGPRDPRLIEAFVRRLGEVVERSRIGSDDAAKIAHERRRAEQLRDLAAAVLHITTASSVPDILRTAAETARAIIGTRDAVATLDSGAAPPWPDQRVSLSAPLAGRTGRALGMMHLSEKVDGTPIRNDDEAILAQLAQTASIAIETVEALERERGARADAEHIARVLQESLLPPDLPAIPGARVAARFRPGGAVVGGDFYDIFPVRGRDWGMIIGDVCGKGADAAALTALARHSIRTAAMLHRQPSRVLSLCNEALQRSNADERFATAAYVRFRPGGRRARLTVGSGGHPPVAVLRSWGDVLFVEGRGSLLGVFDDAGVDDHIVELSDGDSLVMYTDGVTEARNGSELFGERRLIETLRRCRGLDPGQIADRIEHAVSIFESGGPRDDLAILVVTMAG